ncbi:MAG: hypothetical protein IJP13_01100 [Lachnospiraceae bacterium]|nr:hypothetical protein [Lachnospiraceae bacterium]
MENSLKGLILAAGTIITCVVISLGFFIAREAKDTASNGANQINRLNSEFVESDRVIYDGATVSGSEVLNVIKKFQNEKIGILVKTNKSETFYGYVFDEDTGDMVKQLDTEYTLATDSNNDLYINPYVNFVGKLVRDKNEVITGIIFEQ